MDLTSTSLGSKEAVSSINKAFKNFVISSLHSGMCKKSKLRVYRELKEDFECKKYFIDRPYIYTKHFIMIMFYEIKSNRFKECFTVQNCLRSSQLKKNSYSTASKSCYV